MAYLYSIAPGQFERTQDALIDACRRQGITHVTLLASVTGKLLASTDRLAACRTSLESAGLQTSAMVFAVGHPMMSRYYDSQGRGPDQPPHYHGPIVMEGDRDSESPDTRLLPAEWQYAVNEFGNAVYCSACPNAAWLARNIVVMQQLAKVFNEIWLDDEYRMDGDQGAGAAHTSTAGCYCDHCMQRLSVVVGRTVTRQDVLADQKLHDAWIELKTDRLATGVKELQSAARETNPRVAVGLMVRWGGEERDGVDIAKLAPHLGSPPRLRAGEGHFSHADYAPPAAQVTEYLACSYHVSWFPRQTEVLSETTYFAPMPRDGVVKKAALAIAAGVTHLAYCPCVDGYVHYQWFIEYDKALLKICSEAFADKAAMFRPIRILRTAAAGRGDRLPTRRVRDRHYFPLFGLAGLFSTVVRQDGWRDDGDGLLAITGRSAWDFDPKANGNGPLIVDGSALLEQTPLNDWLGIRSVSRCENGALAIEGDVAPDGLLLKGPRVWIIPFDWHDLPAAQMPPLLLDMRRIIGPLTGSAHLDGEMDAMVIHHRYPAYDSLMIVNLADSTRRVSLQLPGERRTLASWAGDATTKQLTLGPHEIRILRAT